MEKREAYIIYQYLIARTDYGKDLIDFGIYGSVDSAIYIMENLADVAKETLSNEEGCTYIVEKSGELENTEFEIHPDYEKDDPALFSGCEDYRHIIQLSLKTVKYIP